MKALNVKGREVMVDNDLYDSLSVYPWYINHYGYVTCRNKQRPIWLHRLVAGNPSKIEGRRAFIDHIDRNPLNNQRSNLRVCTHSQNLANRPKPNQQAGYKGVYWHKGAKKWMARITVAYRGIYLGLFTDPIEAAQAYDKAASQYFGEFAWLNKV